MELRRRSSTPQDAASRAPRFGNSLRIAPRETSGTEGSNPSSSSGESANLRSRFRDDAVRATASKMRRCWLPGSALDESQKIGVELLLMGDRQSVGCAGAAIDFVVGREVQYSRANVFDRASHIGAKDGGQVGS